MTPIDDDLIIAPAKPSFSIVIPTWNDNNALAATLQSLIVQSVPASDFDVEVLVVGDGFDQEAKKIVTEFGEQLHKGGFRLYLWYAALPEHTGRGNVARNAGLQRATKDWVFFLDTGAAATYRCFESLQGALEKHPDVWLITWDMLQLLQPVPIMTSVYAVQATPRTEGMPYILPGCAVALRRDWAQKVEWPDVKSSDWAYYSAVWKEMFGEKEFERTDEVNKHVALIPSTLTVAYAFNKERRVRWPASREDYLNQGFDKAYHLHEQAPVEAPNETEESV